MLIADLYDSPRSTTKEIVGRIKTATDDSEKPKTAVSVSSDYVGNHRFHKGFSRYSNLMSGNTTADFGIYCHSNVEILAVFAFI